ncbi:MAG TPA: hypothetical protein P5534_10015 [Candidatus Paceibacterota bacterium]|mgnify:FL=1|nr:hypothetical protein [Candidatus Paceibacterota bacterium]
MARATSIGISVLAAGVLMAIALIVIPKRQGGPPDEAGLRRAEVWLRDVRDIAARDNRWDFIRWYSYSKIGSAYVVFEGGVLQESALADFRRLVEESQPPVPLSWHVRVLTNGWSLSP